MELSRRQLRVVPGASIKLINSHGAFGGAGNDIKFAAQGSDYLPQS